MKSGPSRAIVFQPSDGRLGVFFALNDEVVCGCAKCGFDGYGEFLLYLDGRCDRDVGAAQDVELCRFHHGPRALGQTLVRIDRRLNSPHTAFKRRSFGKGGARGSRILVLCGFDCSFALV